jgi:hypothetical protein
MELAVSRNVNVKIMDNVTSSLEHVHVKMVSLVQPVVNHVQKGDMVQTVLWNVTVRMEDHVT